MPKTRPKYDDPEQSKRFLEVARQYAPIEDKAFDKALREVASAPHEPAPKPKARKKPAKR